MAGLIEATFEPALESGIIPFDVVKDLRKSCWDFLLKSAI
jgi:hypothetical protein